ncbi:porin-like protein [Breoghania corrubedonensis]|uniref:Porin n=1 Tax=Breoghania corrubedonensis TaxID=665038 RepID=A0A2T5VC69_9HYPH|nr:porin [Breoghania corrubedonensis]PTW61336.1 porin-like protein [Breoghania corrubedonensis]
MTMKTLILGAAAGTLAVAGAQAADLPVAPEPVDYVRVCDAYGAGYFYIPGTETCLRVQGGMRVEFRFRDFADDGNTAWGTRTGNATTTRARAYVRFDSRTQTEYGLLRTFVDLWFTGDSGTGTTPSVTLWNGFIQFGGFTFGRAESFFDFYTGDNWGSIIQQGFSDHRTNLFAYTYGFGNGFSATVSAEDATFVRNGILGTGFNTLATNDAYGGHKWPDLVANLRVDQGWGSAQLMGALHQVYGGAYTGTVAGVTTNYGPLVDSEIGWAIGAGVTFNAPMLAPGDTISFQGAYSKGALRYVHEAAAMPDAVGLTTTDMDTSTGWGIGGGITHHWTPTLSSALTANYASFSNDLGAAADIDVDQWGVQGSLVWSPVSGFLMGVELEYESLDWNTASGLADDDDLVGVFRVQRTF